MPTWETNQCTFSNILISSCTVLSSLLINRTGAPEKKLQFQLFGFVFFFFNKKLRLGKQKHVLKQQKSHATAPAECNQERGISHLKELIKTCRAG